MLVLHHDVEQIAPARYEPADRLRPWRRVPAHLRLCRQQRITADEFSWCEAFARACEAAPRYRGGWTLDDVGGGHTGPEPSESALDAARLVSRVVRAAGAAADLLVGAVVEGYRICDLAVVIGLYPRDDETMSAFGNRVGARVDARVVALIQRLAADED